MMLILLAKASATCIQIKSIRTVTAGSVLYTNAPTVMGGISRPPVKPLSQVVRKEQYPSRSHMGSYISQEVKVGLQWSKLQLVWVSACSEYIMNLPTSTEIAAGDPGPREKTQAM